MDGDVVQGSEEKYRGIGLVADVLVDLAVDRGTGLEATDTYTLLNELIERRILDAPDGLR